MVTSVTDIQTGMEVFGTDGEKIGKVAEVYPNAESTGPMSSGVSSPAGVGDIITEEVNVTPPSAMEGLSGYVKVDHGGILGIGTQHLYIPFSALSNVLPGENVTVSCTKDQCRDLYGTKPDFVETEETDDRPT